MKRILATLLLSAGPAFAQAPPPVPALPDTSRITPYTISASTCSCSVGFGIYSDNASSDVDNWVQVWISSAAGATATRYLSTDPTFGWSLTSPTGSLALIPRPITDAVLTFNSPQTGYVVILGAQRPRRLNEFAENRGVPARDHNQVLNTAFAELREDWDKLNSALVGQPGETPGRLPAAATRANQVLAFDGSGNPTVVSVPSSIPSSTVVGPGSSVVGQLATWCNTLGTLLCDTATLGVPFGGTGQTTFATHGVLLGEGTAAVGTATVGTAGRILVDQGSAADPAFVAPSGLFTINGSGVASAITAATLTTADQTLSGGANVTSLSLTTGSVTVDCGARPLQYITNGGAFTVTAPANDGSCMVLITNNASAGAITWTGFTGETNHGDTLTTTNTSKFTATIWRINGIADYSVHAHQ